MRKVFLHRTGAIVVFDQGRRAFLRRLPLQRRERRQPRPLPLPRHPTRGGLHRRQERPRGEEHYQR